MLYKNIQIVSTMNRKALCLLVLFSILQLNSAQQEELGELKEQLTRSKLHAKSIVRDVSCVKQDLQFSANSKLPPSSQQAKEQTDKILQKGLTYVMRNVNEARAKGKTAGPTEKCLENAKSAIRNSKALTVKTFAKCNDDAIKSLNIHIQALTAVQDIGNHLISEIEGIYPQCSEAHKFVIQTCIKRLLRNITHFSEKFESDAEKTKSAAKKGGSAIISTHAACNAGVIALTRSLTTHIQHQAIVCLNKT